MSVQLVSKISNLCDHNPPTSQTDGRTDRRTDRRTDGRHTIPRPRICTKVHCAVKTQNTQKPSIVTRSSKDFSCWSVSVEPSAVRIEEDVTDSWTVFCSRLKRRMFYAATIYASAQPSKYFIGPIRLCEYCHRYCFTYLTTSAITRCVNLADLDPDVVHTYTVQCRD